MMPHGINTELLARKSAISMQPNLFPLDEPDNFPQIDGLQVIPDLITADEEAMLMDMIDRKPWLTDLKRRVQHYGWKYDYTARRVDESMRLRPLPEWLDGLCHRLQQAGQFPKRPDQVIINEYRPGQGIAPHIDCVPCFGETIASLSLGSPCVMEFTHTETGEKITQLLEPRSLLVLSGEARYHWKHGIPVRKSDKIAGHTIPRGRRLSLTFRKVILGGAA